MNGIQIERVLRMIDANVELSKSEALKYLLEHQDEIINQLLTKGEAVIRTSAGDVKIPLSVVEEAIA